MEQVNRDPYFLGKVTRVVRFGSMLTPETEQLSDVALAVEIASKETDFDRARVKNLERVEVLVAAGHRFRNFLEQEGYWYWEIFGFLKGRSRVISLADYAGEKTFVLAVPHRDFLVKMDALLALAKPGAVFADVKSRLPLEAIRAAGLVVWRL